MFFTTSCKFLEPAFDARKYKKIYCKLAISIPRIQVSLSSTPNTLQLCSNVCKVTFRLISHIRNICHGRILGLQYFCQHFPNIFVHGGLLLKGMALPQNRFLYLASLVSIVAKATCHHKLCNIQGFRNTGRLTWHGGKMVSCDFHYVCVTPAHGIMSPWTHHGRCLIPMGLIVIHRKLFGNLSIASFWRGDITTGC